MTLKVVGWDKCFYQGANHGTISKNIYESRTSIHIFNNIVKVENLIAVVIKVRLLTLVVKCMWSLTQHFTYIYLNLKFK